jgi:capsular exopolysaccharide synthesis family protein
MAKPANLTKEVMFGSEQNFAVSEAYKFLRTNVMFSFSAEVKCPIIGVTSSLRGEGKSTTSINLAISIAKSGKRVLLIDSDMRLPSVADKLDLKLSPGLSNLLVQGISVNGILQKFDDVSSLDILTAGDVPPNPSELIGSPRMERFLSEAKERYDYIIIDLPPVTAVTDALTVSNLLDGVILVVKNDYDQKKAIAETLRQLKLVNIRILGFAYTCANVSTGGYYKKYYKQGYYGASE